MRKKWLLSIIFAVIASILVACGGNEDESEEDANQESETTQEEESAEDSEGGEGAEQPEMPQPDLEGIPEVVAEVNGEEISKDEFETTYTGQFQQASMQSQMTGQEVDEDQLKGQVAEMMVGSELLIQEADNGGFEASEEEINETMDEIVELNGLSSQDEFIAAMEEQGMGEEEIMSQIEMQVKVDQLIASETGDLEPTDEELEEAYDMLTAQQEQMQGEEAEIPSFDELKPDLEEQVKAQKEGEATQALVEKLRENADVTVHL